MKITILLVLFAPLAIAVAQITTQTSSPSLLQRARKGDDSALTQMEQTGDLQDLRSLLRDQGYTGKSAVRLILARLGDQQSLQYFACRSLTDDVDKMQLLLRDDFDNIGGAFTIEIYRQLLDSDERFLTYVDKNREHKYSDVTVKLPSSMVLSYLSKLLPTANIPSLPFGDWPNDEKQLKNRWRAWIDSHQNEIREMKPKAQGINFSSSFCAQFIRNVKFVE